MKSKTSVLALAFAMVAATACGGSPVSSGSMAGKTWSTTCSDTVATGSIGPVKAVSFTETEMTGTETYYKDNCSTVAATVTTVFTYEIGDEIGEQFELVDNARKLTLTLKSVSATLAQADAVTAYNAASGSYGFSQWACAKTDWALSTAVDILALTGSANCGAMFINNAEGVSTRLAAGQVYYEVIGIEELANDKSRLYLTTSNAARPSAYNTDAALQMGLELDSSFNR